MDAFEPLRLVASGCSQCGHGHRESMDPGFSAYLGLVLTDAHYSNPTLLSFVSLLWGSQMRKPPLPPPAASIQPDSDDDIPLLDLASLTDDEKDRRAGESRWRRKWFVFLVFFCATCSPHRFRLSFRALCFVARPIKINLRARFIVTNGSV